MTKCSLSLAEMIRLAIEILLGIATVCCAHIQSTQWGAAQLLSIGDVISSVSGTLLGFILAALAILAALPQTPFVEKLRNNGHVRSLMSTLFWSGFCFGLASLGGLASVFFVGTVAKYLICASTGVFVVASLRLAQSGQRFYSVMALL